MAQMTAAIFDSRDDADRAVAALRDHGIDQDDISVLARADDGSGRTSDLDASDRVKAPGKGEGITTTTPGDAAKGAEEGLAIGAGVGILAGLASIFVPGFGLVAAGGALATAIGGMVGTAVGGAVVGGLTGYFMDLGVPEHAARDYSEAIKSGGILVSVLNTHGVTPEEIHEILMKYNGRNTGSYDNLTGLPAQSTMSNPDRLDATNPRVLTGPPDVVTDEDLEPVDETEVVEVDRVTAVKSDPLDKPIGGVPPAPGR